jgi:hypothetical protein
MFDALTARSLIKDEPPDGPRRRVVGRRLGAILAVAAALAMSFAMMAAPQSAEAVTSIDGQWTVVHGGTGNISFNSNGTYTSTCQVYPNYPDAWCPAPSGTFQYGTLRTASVTFTGTDGSTTSYRVSGDVSSPDTITSLFGSTTYSALVMKKGTAFVCTGWGDNGYRMVGSPLVEYDAVNDILYATGSHENLGPANADNSVSLAETAPNYFRSGGCDSFGPAVHISLRDASTLSPYSTGGWIPTVNITVTDLHGAPILGAYVHGTFAGQSDFYFDCTSTGTCTASGYTLADSVPSTVFTVLAVTRDGSFPISSRDSLQLTVNNPSAKHGGGHGH